MRYCINCGSPMGDERFCNQCGTDNGAVIKNTPIEANNTNASNIPTVDLSFILHIASVAMFVIAVFILLIICCKQADYIAVQSMLYTGTAFLALPYFVIGMWGCIPALLLLLNIKENNSSSVVGAAIVMIIMMIVICLINIILAKSNGFIKIFSIMANVYKTKAVAVIVLEILAAALGVIAPRVTM